MRHDLESELQQQTWVRGNSDPKNRNGSALLYCKSGHLYVILTVEWNRGAVHIGPPMHVDGLDHYRKNKLDPESARRFNDADQIFVTVPPDHDMHEYLFKMGAAYASVKPYVDPEWDRVACAWHAPAYAGPKPPLPAELVKQSTLWQRIKDAYRSFWKRQK
jgi:hypothetical protein